MKKAKLFLLLLAIPFIGVIGYFLMRMSVHAIPLSQGDNFTYLYVTLVIIALGLAVPYLMMKVGFKGAQMTDSLQKPLKLDDLPEPQHKAAKN